ncbi:hypothetical protein D3C76_1180870 [compost metagenome]
MQDFRFENQAATNNLIEFSVFHERGADCEVLDAMSCLLDVFECRRDWSCAFFDIGHIGFQVLMAFPLTLHRVYEQANNSVNSEILSVPVKQN